MRAWLCSGAKVDKQQNQLRRGARLAAVLPTELCFSMMMREGPSKSRRLGEACVQGERNWECRRGAEMAR